MKRLPSLYSHGDKRSSNTPKIGLCVADKGNKADGGQVSHVTCLKLDYLASYVVNTTIIRKMFSYNNLTSAGDKDLKVFNHVKETSSSSLGLGFGFYNKVLLVLLIANWHLSSLGEEMETTQPVALWEVAFF